MLDAVSRLLTTIRWPGALLCQPYTASTRCSQCSHASLALATVPQCKLSGQCQTSLFRGAAVLVGSITPGVVQWQVHAFSGREDSRQGSASRSSRPRASAAGRHWKALHLGVAADAEDGGPPDHESMACQGRECRLQQRRILLGCGLRVICNLPRSHRRRQQLPHERLQIQRPHIVQIAATCRQRRL